MSELKELYAAYMYPSKTAFMPIARKAGFSRKEIDELMATRTEQQVFTVPKIPEGHFDHRAYDMVLIADLMDFSRWDKSNRNFRWCLNVLEWHSRRAWSFALKTKEPGPIAAKLEDVIKSLDESTFWVRRKVTENTMLIRLVVDDGNEFRGQVTEMLERYPLVHLLVNTPARKSTAPVERFNQTLLGMIRRVFIGARTNNWVGALDGLVDIYNKTPHSSTGKAPYDLFDQGHEAVIDLDNIPKRRFKVGDRVRAIQRIDIFKKRTITPKLSMEVYEIVALENEYYVLDNGEKRLDKELVAAKDPGVAEQKEIREHVAGEKVERTRKRVNRLNRKEAAIGHEAEVDELGQVRLKARVLPKDPVRVRSRPKRFE